MAWQQSCREFNDVATRCAAAYGIVWRRQRTGARRGFRMLRWRPSDDRHRREQRCRASARSDRSEAVAHRQRDARDRRASAVSSPAWRETFCADAGWPLSPGFPSHGGSGGGQSPDASKNAVSHSGLRAMSQRSNASNSLPANAASRISRSATKRRKSSSVGSISMPPAARKASKSSLVLGPFGCGPRRTTINLRSAILAETPEAVSAARNRAHSATALLC